MKTLALGILVCVACAVGSYASPSGRVVGGIDATAGQFPHQISLRINGAHNCGGSIISRNFVLTAAHCVGGTNSNGDYVTYDPKYLNIRAGSNDRLQGGVIVGVVEIIVHEDYGNFLNDVALLRLAQPLIFSKNIQAVPLASTEVPAGASVIISGWGRLKQGGDVPQKLQWNTLSAITRAQCKEEIGFDSDAVICLAHPANNGACNGDSGGPALYNGEVVGIAGFVYTGCGTSYPDGYAKVFYHVDWIRQHAELN